MYLSDLDEIGNDTGFYCEQATRAVIERVQKRTDQLGWNSMDDANACCACVEYCAISVR